MKQPLEIPIIFKRVRIDGIHASREVDMILDTGAMYTAISWDIAKDIGYEPELNKPLPCWKPELSDQGNKADAKKCF